VAHTSLTHSNSIWFALHVRSRHEKAVASLLRAKGLESFLPFCRSRRQWSQRISEIEVPLFPGYVFCRFDPGSPGALIVTTPGVIGIVGFGRHPVPIEAREIEAIRRVLDKGLPAQPWKYTASGQRVRVEYGVLAGLEGIFVTAMKNHHLLLSVSILQRSVAIQIDESCVVPLSPPGLPAAVRAGGNMLPLSPVGL